jgi:hypothetical protein
VIITPILPKDPKLAADYSLGVSLGKGSALTSFRFDTTDFDARAVFLDYATCKL